ncbi:hypothetical protein DRP05_10535 [Archaeoglobales archaeon]|nr:MAG: hypothetical protein DRP05_10535 [Archaeoglobales archaeon]
MKDNGRGKERRNMSIYIEKELLDRMDKLGIKNRSQFINDVIAERLDEIEEALQQNEEIKKILEHPYLAVMALIRE